MPVYWEGNTVVGSSKGEDTSGNPIDPVGKVPGPGQTAYSGTSSTYTPFPKKEEPVVQVDTVQSTIQPTKDIGFFSGFHIPTGIQERNQRMLDIENRLSSPISELPPAIAPPPERQYYAVQQLPHEISTRYEYAPGEKVYGWSLNPLFIGGLDVEPGGTYRRDALFYVSKTGTNPEWLAGSHPPTVEQKTADIQRDIVLFTVTGFLPLSRAAIGSQSFTKGAISFGIEKGIQGLKTVSDRIPYGIGFGKPKGILIKAEDVYTVPSETSVGTDIVPKQTLPDIERPAVFATQPKGGLTDLYVKPDKEFANRAKQYSGTMTTEKTQFGTYKVFTPKERIPDSISSGTSVSSEPLRLRVPQIGLSDRPTPTELYALSKLETTHPTSTRELFQVSYPIFRQMGIETKDIPMFRFADAERRGVKLPDWYWTDVAGFATTDPSAPHAFGNKNAVYVKETMSFEKQINTIGHEMTHVTARAGSGNTFGSLVAETAAYRGEAEFVNRFNKYYPTYVPVTPKVALGYIKEFPSHTIGSNIRDYIDVRLGTNLRFRSDIPNIGKPKDEFGGYVNIKENVVGFGKKLYNNIPDFPIKIVKKVKLYPAELKSGPLPSGLLSQYTYDIGTTARDVRDSVEFPRQYPSGINRPFGTAVAGKIDVGRITGIPDRPKLVPFEGYETNPDFVKRMVLLRMGQREGRIFVDIPTAAMPVAAPTIETLKTGSTPGFGTINVGRRLMQILRTQTVQKPNIDIKGLAGIKHNVRSDTQLGKDTLQTNVRIGIEEGMFKTDTVFKIGNMYRPKTISVTKTTPTTGMDTGTVAVPRLGMPTLSTPGLIPGQTPFPKFDIPQTPRPEPPRFGRGGDPLKPPAKFGFPGGGFGGKESKSWKKYFRTMRVAPIAKPDLKVPKFKFGFKISMKTIGGFKF